jgi:hypothetical protein
MAASTIALRNIVSTSDFLERFYTIYQIPIDYSYNNIKSFLRSSYGHLDSQIKLPSSCLTIQQQQLFDVFDGVIKNHQHQQVDIFPIIYIFQFIQKWQLVNFLRFFHVKMSVLESCPSMSMYPSYDSLRIATIQELYDHISSLISQSDENFFSFIVLFRAYFLSSKLDK